MPSHSYEVRVSGDLDGLEALGDVGMVESVEHDVTTVLSGRFADQEALSAFLRRLRAHGLEVVEIRRVVGGADSESDVDEPEEPGVSS